MQNPVGPTPTQVGGDGGSCLDLLIGCTQPKAKGDGGSHLISRDAAKIHMRSGLTPHSLTNSPRAHPCLQPLSPQGGEAEPELLVLHQLGAGVSGQTPTLSASPFSLSLLLRPLSE